MNPRSTNRLSARDYEALAAFRQGLRRFLAFSEAAAKTSGLTPQQHQALLAIKGHRGAEPATIKDLAENLLIKHHSAVELSDRLVASDLVTRAPSTSDRRSVQLVLTAKAETILETLSARHLEELRRSRGLLQQLLDRLGPDEGSSG